MPGSQLSAEVGSKSSVSNISHKCLTLNAIARFGIAAAQAFGLGFVHFPSWHTRPSPLNQATLQITTRTACNSRSKPPNAITPSNPESGSYRTDPSGTSPRIRSGCRRRHGFRVKAYENYALFLSGLLSDQLFNYLDRDEGFGVSAKSLLRL